MHLGLALIILSLALTNGLVLIIWGAGRGVYCHSGWREGIPGKIQAGVQRLRAEGTFFLPSSWVRLGWFEKTEEVKRSQMLL